jgi:hypothetical protein
MSATTITRIISAPFFALTISIVLLTHLTVIHAQQFNTRAGVVFKNGTTETGAVLLYELTPEGSFFRLDEKKIPSSDVTFFKSAHGYFGNASALEGRETYGMRVRKGYISQYERIKIKTYQADTLPNFGKLSDFASGEKMHYYHIQEQPLKKITYKNLKQDIYSYVPSQLYLKDYFKFKCMQYGMLGIGLGLVASSILTQGSNVNFTPGIILGTLLTGGSFGALGSQRDALDSAIKAYNEKDKWPGKQAIPQD